MASTVSNEALPMRLTLVPSPIAKKHREAPPSVSTLPKPSSSTTGGLLLSYKTGRPLKAAATFQKRYDNDTAPNAMDLAVIRNRNYLDPQRFYKSSDTKNNTAVSAQIGTVVTDSTDHTRQSRAERRGHRSLTEQVRADVRIRHYALGKYKSMQQAQTAKKKTLRKKRS
jgi:Fcf2 pre-rRNA processing